jgi:hypothetical protein
MEPSPKKFSKKKELEIFKFFLRVGQNKHLSVEKKRSF